MSRRAADRASQNMKKATQMGGDALCCQGPHSGLKGFRSGCCGCCRLSTWGAGPLQNCIG